MVLGAVRAGATREPARLLEVKTMSHKGEGKHKAASEGEIDALLMLTTIHLGIQDVLGSLEAQRLQQEAEQSVAASSSVTVQRAAATVAQEDEEMPEHGSSRTCGATT